MSQKRTRPGRRCLRCTGWLGSASYRADPGASKVLSIKTEFMLMNKDGSGLQQLTRFKEAGHPESSEGIAANGSLSHDGRSATERRER